MSDAVAAEERPARRPSLLVGGRPHTLGTTDETPGAVGVGGSVVPGNGRTPHRGLSGRNLVDVDNRNEIREFLTSRRGRITPEQAGLPAYGGHRRVPGLRREEAAMLAGVSVDYYTRLERGNLNGVSDSVLDARARALHLDDAERAHLFDLARAANRTPWTRRRPRQQQVRPGVQRLLDATTSAPAFVLNRRLDILAANQLGYALYSEMYTEPVRPANHARFLFLNPRATDFWSDWERAANDTVALLRAEAGRDPYDRGLSDLVGELSTRSEEFRVRWAAHNVRFHTTGIKRFHHPVVGDLELAFESFPLAADPGQSLLPYTAEPGQPSRESYRGRGCRSGSRPHRRAGWGAWARGSPAHLQACWQAGAGLARPRQHPSTPAQQNLVLLKCRACQLMLWTTPGDDAGHLTHSRQLSLVAEEVAGEHGAAGRWRPL